MLRRACYIILLTLFVAACDVPTQQELDQQRAAAESASSENDSTSDSNSAINSKKVSHLLMGTGSVQGVYFPIGGVICRLLNRQTHLHKIRCSLESTGGSISNLRQLRSNNFDMVFAQSDWQFHAYHGTSTFEKDGPDNNLRAVFALEADPLALIVKEADDINSFDDLEDKVVSFGYQRSLQHRIIDDYLKAREWKDSKFKNIYPMSDARQLKKLCEGELDAILLLTSSLNDQLSNIEDDCKMKLIAIDDQFVEKAITTNPYYRKGNVLASLAPGIEEGVMSFGLGATFVAEETTSPKAIYHVVKEVVENFNDFKSLHPSLADLHKRDLPYAGISIPLHPGAIRYYREARLLKK